ncbi:MAG: MbnP family protein [Reichenbachiella sp.]|uniref:MbnP family protein n=1 Tax=Reichenbachiella sp. TaxID=2184521 RepID=UPI003262E371
MKHFRTLLGLSVLIISLICLSACSSDDDIETKTLTFHFEAQALEESLIFEAKKYLTPSNQTMTFERIKIYLSNIQLKDKNTNEVYFELDSYHLISFDQDNATASFTVEGVPAAYVISEIGFHIGVNSEANTSIDHLGDLDPTNGMAWDWNTGYKFLLLEGRYFSTNNPIGEEIKMHIGTDKNYFSYDWSPDQPIAMSQDQEISFIVDGFAPLGTIDFSEGTVFMNDERGDEVAQNYKMGLIQPK